LAEGRGNPEVFHAFDIQFHDAFAQASGNVAIQATVRMLYHATSEARMAVLPFIDNWDRHWRRHERVFICIRDHKPALARKAVLEDLHYAESLLREHAASLSKGRLDGEVKRTSTNSNRRKR
jgi:DNA-binding FadR family transcriptional regulator